MSQLKPLKTSRRALRDQVYEQLFELLLQGDLEPGTRLSIDTLARDLQVSPTPVREAMVHLERTGLVTREALRGYHVAPPLSREQFNELFDARLMLETTATQKASASPGPVAEDLRRAQERHIEAGMRVITAHESGERVPLRVTQEYFEADAQFHAVLFEHANNRYLSDMYQQLDALTHRMRQAALQGPDDVKEAIEEHQAVMEAFTTGSQEDTIAAITRHIDGARHRAISDSEARDQPQV